MTKPTPQPFEAGGLLHRTRSSAVVTALRCRSCLAYSRRENPYPGALLPARPTEVCPSCGAPRAELETVTGYWITTERREPRALGLLGHRWREVSRSFRPSRWQQRQPAPAPGRAS